MRAILLCEQMVLMELSELLSLKLAAALRIDPRKVLVQWHLEGAKAAVGRVASLVGAARYVRGAVVPEVSLDKDEDFSDFRKGEVEELVRGMCATTRAHAEARLRGLRSKRKV